MVRSRRQRLYLDTSVLSAYFDGRSPERRALTVLFWDLLDRYDTWISDLVLAEISATDDRGLADGMLRLAAGLQTSSVGEEARVLAREYLVSGAVPGSASVDAVHVAVATVLEADAVVSWNLRHLVRQRTRDSVNLINSRFGYRPLVITTPAEFLEE
ncbi:MAG: PIN domain-containing protein [Deltaproteobacteria bacterium]|nr:PIN domain-containing protein [Deltaproteobacteria bacterium]